MEEGLSFNVTHLLWATALGGLSAFSLPLGSLVGVAVRPRARITGIAAAFGAGALVAALALELVAPTVQALVSHHGGGHHGDPHLSFAALMVGALVGGVLFVVLDQLVNAHGGFLRKTATSITYLSRRRDELNRALLEDLSRSRLLTNVPASLTEALLERVRPVSFVHGEVLFDQGDPGDTLYFIQSGTIDLAHDNEGFTSLTAGDVLGEISVLTGATRSARATAADHVQALALHRDDFEALRAESPELDSAARELASSRLDDLRSRVEANSAARTAWTEEAAEALRQGNHVPTESEVRKAAAEHGGAPLAIWLGILLDGIPESFVIGTGFLALLASKVSPETSAETIPFLEVVPYTLIAGLFLSNFPEAMSSSVGMARQGLTSQRILLLWGSLMVMTGVGAGIGYSLGGSLAPELIIGIEGVAAGAMLTMIAATMLPEAVHLGGANTVGLSTLVGFLSAVAFKVFE